MRIPEEAGDLGGVSSARSGVYRSFSSQGAECNRLDRWRWLAEHVVPHEPWLRRWLRRRGLDHEIEDDVVQESYLLLLQTDRVDHVRHPRNYFCQTARSVILRNARRAAIVRMEGMCDAQVAQIAHDAPLQDEVLASRQELRLLLRTVKELPERTRDVFRLRRLDGLSLMDTAEKLGISQSAVEKHLRSATRRLGSACGRLGSCAG